MGPSVTYSVQRRIDKRLRRWLLALNFALITHQFHVHGPGGAELWRSPPVNINSLHWSALRSAAAMIRTDYMGHSKALHTVPSAIASDCRIMMIWLARRSAAKSYTHNHFDLPAAATSELMDWTGTGTWCRAGFDSRNGVWCWCTWCDDECCVKMTRAYTFKGNQCQELKRFENIV